MMKLLIPVFVLQVFVYQTFGKVVQSFKNSCPTFFVADPSDQNIHYPPTVLNDTDNPQRYQQICQHFKDKERYATLYDTKSRIPVYSAYYYVGYHKVDKAEWKIEPQLDDPDLGPNMERESTVKESVRGKNQALFADYASQTQYTRGHLYPRCYSESQDCAIATYTHTNAVPQTKNDNNVWGKKAETKMKKNIDDNCDNGIAHVVTGAVPGNFWLEIKRDNVHVEKGVNIPNNFWTAYCCLDKTTQSPLSGAWLATRNPKGLIVQKKTVKQLENNLTTLYGITEGNFSVFGGLCQGSDNISDFYELIFDLFLEMI
ncbi:endonuclease domain-containing 1 protein-like [Pygocentrus nattereri]|uniref:endonuclease domain-containing 1 protein-like n=1 Tax=Pygocentrus nattereri TaxID=42514 RepID=UPI000814A982|nr:endonuclease domain-containing 1 protein-like [Pygocentrus nattereri]